MSHGDFSIHHVGGTRFLSHMPWWTGGFKHGMTTTDLSFSQAERAECARRLCESCEADYLILLKQVHGREVVDCRNSPTLAEMLEGASSRFAQIREGDALIAPARQPLSGKRLLFGVLTADCVPVVLRSDAGFAVIHAGWRGLAKGIIAASADALTGLRDGAVFACAGSGGSGCYEVGDEVIAAIGEAAACMPSAAGVKFHLDTAETALTQLRQIGPDGLFVSAGICTISDLRFHSFRRDAEGAGRGVTFICPPD
jgi:copper oxidase (laccase) domain-containing protein